MGKKKVSKGRSNKLPAKVEVLRGITVVELTRKGKQFFDSKGNEYEAKESHGSVAYYLKKAQLVTSKVLMGVCSKNKKHRIHTDTLPRSKKCSCGGEYIFTDLKSEGADVPQVKTTSNKKATPTPKKRKKGK
jgi:hypothetical protein